MAPPGALDLLRSSSSPHNSTGSSDWTQVSEAVRWIQLVMSVLSVSGSGSIMMFTAAHRLLCSELQPLVLLSGVDLLLALCRLLGAAMFSVHAHTHTCFHVHTAEQVLFMASFFFTLNYVWSLYVGVRHRLYCSINGYFLQEPRGSAGAARTTALLSGFLPVVLMSPVLIKGNIAHCKANSSQPYGCLLMCTGVLRGSGSGSRSSSCRILSQYRTAMFLCSFLLTLSAIMVLLGKTRQIYRRVVTSSGFLGDRQWASLRTVDRRMVLYPLVLIFCWAPALCMATMRLVDPGAAQGTGDKVVYICQAFSSASQGFLNCLLYGWTHSHFRSRTLRRDADTQTPLLHSQRVGGHHRPGYQALRPTG